MLKFCSDMYHAVALFEDAYRTAMKAGEAVVPEPMFVVSGSMGLPKKKYVVESGVCGYAWVNFMYHDKACHQFCKYIMQAQEAHVMPAKDSVLDYNKADGQGYPAKWELWCGEFGQSMTRKMAFASKFAGYMNALGIPCSTGSRMD